MGTELLAVGVVGESGTTMAIKAGGASDDIEFQNSSGTKIAAIDVSASALVADLLNEATTDAGVTIEGILMKDDIVAANTINEKTADTGVTIEGILLKDDIIAVDIINEATADTGVTIDGVLMKDDEINVDTINQKTADTGVTIEGVLLKGDAVYVDNIAEDTTDAGVTIEGILMKDSIVAADTINEKTADAGVTIEGILLKDSIVAADTINEKTADAGVTIEGNLLKDNQFKPGTSGIDADGRNISNLNNLSAKTSTNIIVTLGDSAGSTGIQFYDADSNEVFSVNSDGDVTSKIPGGATVWSLVPDAGITCSIDLTLSGGATIKGVPAPSEDGDVASKSYVDGVAAGLDPKESCLAATTEALSTFVAAGSGVGKTLEAPTTASSFNTIDDITLAVDDRVLVKDGGPNGTPNIDNGIYTVTVLGNDSDTKFKLTRATDFDGSPAGEVSGGNFTFIEQGTAAAGKGYVVVFDGNITVDTDAIAWTQFSQAAAYTAGDGISIKSGEIAVELGSTNPGLEFVAGELAVLPDPDGPVTLGAAGVNIALGESLGLNDDDEINFVPKDGAGIQSTDEGAYLLWGDAAGQNQQKADTETVTDASSGNVTFTSPFGNSVTPVIIAIPRFTSAPGTIPAICVHSVDATGFTWKSTGNFTGFIDWVAINNTTDLSDFVVP